MDVTRVILHDKRLELQVKVQRPWTRLTDEDIARLNNKREELIMILRQWHHYSRMQAERIISDWLSHHSQERPYHTELFPPKGQSKPSHDRRPDINRKGLIERGCLRGPA
jgi:hypothetical protein